MKLLNIILMTAMVLCLTATASQAERERGKWRERQAVRQSQIAARMSDKNRQILSEYLKANPQRPCPPRLARKGGCMPSESSGRKFEIGAILPPDIPSIPVPSDILKQLDIPSPDYGYVQVEDTILMVNNITKEVMDSVSAAMSSIHIP
jgi:hypothetical protein